MWPMIKGSILLFSLLNPVAFGCTFNLNNCTYDASCPATDIDLSRMPNGAEARDCPHVPILNKKKSEEKIDYLFLRLFITKDIRNKGKLSFNDNSKIFLESIISIDFFENGLSNIPTLPYMPNLKTLNVSHNNISTAKLSNPTLLNALKTIDLSYNSIHTLMVDVNQYLFQTLKSLNLSHNALTSINGSIFNLMTTLEILDLSYNRLILDQDSFKGLKSLQYLYLSQNGISEINSFLFNGMVQLKNLDISHNAINVIQEDAFNNTDNLNVLDLSYNNLTDFFVNVNDNNKLFILILNNNNINNLALSVFKNLVALENLDLSFNSLSEIQPNKFNNNSKLQELNLSHNLLPSLKYGTFRGLSNLKRIDLSFNRFRDMRPSWFYGLKSLETLIIDYNNIKKIDEDFIALKLQSLSIGDNLLSCEAIANMKYKSKFKIVAMSIIDETSTDNNIDGIICDKNKEALTTEAKLYEGAVQLTSTPQNPLPEVPIISSPGNMVRINDEEIKMLLITLYQYFMHINSSQFLNNKQSNNNIVTQRSTDNSLVSIAVCVALALIMLVVFFLYVIYKNERSGTWCLKKIQMFKHKKDRDIPVATIENT